MTNNVDGDSGADLGSLQHPITLTPEKLIEWAEKQMKEYSDSVFVAKTPPEAYRQALKHLIHHIKNPIEYIL